MINEQKQRVKTRRTPAGFIIEIDPASWAEMMTALSIAIDATRNEPERAASLRKLRTALSEASR